MKAFRQAISLSYQGNLPRFFAMYALYNFMFFMPIWVIFLQDKHHISLTQVTFVDFAFWITMALTEVPTGVVADTLGRKPSLFIGMSLAVGSVLLFGLAGTYPLLLLANSLWGIAITFISGADIAFFYDTLHELGRVGEYPRLRGRLSAVGLVAAGFGNIVGGLLAAWNLTSPFILYAAVLALAALLVLTFKEPRPVSEDGSGLRKSYRETLGVAFGAIYRKPALRYALGYSNLLPLAAAAVSITFIQPHAIAIGVPLAAIGFLVFGLTLFRILGATNSGRVVEWFGEWRWLVLAAMLSVLGVFGLGALPNLAGVGIFSLAVFASAASRPLIEDLLLRQTPGSVRATILSVDNLIFRFLLAFIEPAVGLVADAVGLPLAFVAMALVVGIGLLVLLLFWHRVWNQAPVLVAPAIE
jgi:predicted MFS family arabinose efflux permease